jgi:hypothetical protein
VPGRQKMLVRIGSFCYHPWHLRGFKYQVKEIRGFKYRFGVLDTCQQIRGFKYQDSGYQIPGFGVLHTKLRGFKYRGVKIRERAEGVRVGCPGRNTLNTDSNLINTGPTTKREG